MGLFSKKRNEQLNESSKNFEEKQETKDWKFDQSIEFDESHITHFLPHSYDETQKIADCLLRFKNVTVKLTEIDRDDKKRLIDFLTGVMYAREGSYKKIDKSIYYFWINT